MTRHPFGPQRAQHTRLVASIARSANAPVGGKRCKTNFYVIASYDPELSLRKLWARAPEAYDRRRGLGRARRFLHPRDPVRDRTMLIVNPVLHPISCFIAASD
jgi:hypothetical protein